MVLHHPRPQASMDKGLQANHRYSGLQEVRISKFLARALPSSSGYNDFWPEDMEKLRA